MCPNYRIRPNTHTAKIRYSTRHFHTHMLSHIHAFKHTCRSKLSEGHSTLRIRPSGMRADASARRATEGAEERRRQDLVAKSTKHGGNAMAAALFSPMEKNIKHACSAASTARETGRLRRRLQPQPQCSRAQCVGHALAPACCGSCPALMLASSRRGTLAALPPQLPTPQRSDMPRCSHTSFPVPEIPTAQAATRAALRQHGKRTHLLTLTGKAAEAESRSGRRAAGSAAPASSRNILCKSPPFHHLSCDCIRKNKNPASLHPSNNTGRDSSAGFSHTKQNLHRTKGPLQCCHVGTRRPGYRRV